MDRLQKINTLSCYSTYSDIFTNNTENLQLTRVFQMQINEKLQILNHSQNQMIYLNIPSRYRIKKKRNSIICIYQITLKVLFLDNLQQQIESRFSHTAMIKSIQFVKVSLFVACKAHHSPHIGVFLVAAKHFQITIAGNQV